MDLLDEDFYASPWALTRQLGNNTIPVLYVITVLSQHHAFPSQLRVDLWRFINSNIRNVFGSPRINAQAGVEQQPENSTATAAGDNRRITHKLQLPYVGTCYCCCTIYCCSTYVHAAVSSAPNIAELVLSVRTKRINCFAMPSVYCYSAECWLIQWTPNPSKAWTGIQIVKKP